jgi:hypothetical protein
MNYLGLTFFHIQSQLFDLDRTIEHLLLPLSSPAAEPGGSRRRRLQNHPPMCIGAWFSTPTGATRCNQQDELDEGFFTSDCGGGGPDHAEVEHRGGNWITTSNQRRFVHPWAQAHTLLTNQPRELEQRRIACSATMTLILIFPSTDFPWPVDARMPMRQWPYGWRNVTVPYPLIPRGSSPQSANTHPRDLGEQQAGVCYARNSMEKVLLTDWTPMAVKGNCVHESQCTSGPTRRRAKPGNTRGTMADGVNLVWQWARARVRKGWLTSWATGQRHNMVLGLRERDWEWAKQGFRPMTQVGLLFCFLFKSPNFKSHSNFKCNSEIALNVQPNLNAYLNVSAWMHICFYFIILLMQILL